MNSQKCEMWNVNASVHELWCGKPKRNKDLIFAKMNQLHLSFVCRCEWVVGSCRWTFCLCRSLTYLQTKNMYRCDQTTHSLRHNLTMCIIRQMRVDWWMRRIQSYSIEDWWDKVKRSTAFSSIIILDIWWLWEIYKFDFFLHIHESTLIIQRENVLIFMEFQWWQ